MAFDESAWKQYLVPGTGLQQFGIRAVAFQQYELPGRDGMLAERSMLTPSELALLFALAKDYYIGAGEIIDLGPLLGVGTHALARGLALNARDVDKRKRIHSFDLFLAKGVGTVITERARSGSVLDRFLRNTSTYAEHISVSAGDLLQMTWDGAPIEILFIDVSKTWQLNNHVVKEFFPHMIPGRTIVVQQDYVHFCEYWIPITMELFSEYFRQLHYVDGATSVFLLTREIPNELLFQDIEALPIDRKLDLLDRARIKAPPTVGEVLKCAQARCLMDHDRHEEAASLLRRVNFSPRRRDESPDFAPAISANFRAVVDELRGRGGAAREAAADLLPGDESTAMVCELDVVLDRSAIASKDRFVGRVGVRNSGTRTWSLVDAPVGVVNLGAHLLDESGNRVIEFDFLRRRIGEPPRDTVGCGEEIHFTIEFSPPRYGRYVLEFDLVCEMICWFARNGSKTVRIPISVA